MGFFFCCCFPLHFNFLFTYILNHIVWSLAQYCCCYLPAITHLGSRISLHIYPRQWDKLLLSWITAPRPGAKAALVTRDFKLHTFVMQFEVAASKGCCLWTDLAVGTSRLIDWFNYLLLSNCVVVSTKSTLVMCYSQALAGWLAPTPRDCCSPTSCSLVRSFPFQEGSVLVFDTGRILCEAWSRFTDRPNCLGLRHKC